MKYTLEVTERVNLGQYEYIEISGAVEFSTADVRSDPAEHAEAELDALLRCHRRRALALLPEDSESFMIIHPALEP